MSKTLIIVESPTKAKTISRFLGKEFDIRASYGHVRDLPNDASEIPANLKKEKWARLGVNVEKEFEPLYIVPDDKKKRVKELKDALSGAEELFLATDEDREGESISWHLLEVLKPKIKPKRLVFHEITKSAIDEALKNPRTVDMNLVKAQETRRVVDRLFGYTLSPLLWKKMAPKLSAGRVQSVAMRLLVERERERIKFKTSEYWDILGHFSNTSKKQDSFAAELFKVAGERIAEGKDFDSLTGKLKETKGVKHLMQSDVEALTKNLVGKTAKVSFVEEKSFTTKPYPPFTTSTLQQEGSRKLYFSAKRTMQVAQTLYEHGFITYMRTDSTNLSEQAIEGARKLIARDFGKEYLPPQPRIYKTNVKNAQEAHEAIRPAGEDFATVATVNSKLGPEAAKLYELIWKRMLACQMKDAEGLRVSVQLEVENATFKTTGRTIQFAGFLRAYVEGSDDPQAELADRERVLPPLKLGDLLQLTKAEPRKHETQAPPRFSEGSLIKELERLGIGRPSTWATIVDVVLSRNYAFKRGTALVPSFLACAVTQVMERYFKKVIDYEFTAKLESDLDAISRGEEDGIEYLKNFFLGDAPGLEPLVKLGEEQIDPRDVCGLPIGVTDSGKNIEVRIGRFGPFLTDGELKSSLPEGIAPDEMTVEKAVQILSDSAKGPESVGIDPNSGKAVYVKAGRFGPYVQLGEAESDGTKPKMVSLLPGMTPSEVTLEIACGLLAFPKLLGTHPESGEEIFAALGRYGPYVSKGKDNRTITADLNPLEITLEQAVQLFAQPKTRGRQVSAAPAKSLRELGANDQGKAISIRSGRFGPYVTDGELNASLKGGLTIEGITLEEAVALLAARAEYLANKGEDTKPTQKKKRAAKK